MTEPSSENAPTVRADAETLQVPATAADVSHGPHAARRSLLALRPGQRFGPYEVLGTLGKGGMGTVYRARDTAAAREVALKLLNPDALSAASLARFHREGELAARLDHPGIVRVHAAGEVEGAPYLAFELVEAAQPLSAAFQGAPLPRVVELVRDAAQALAHAHERGVVHRDLKPANILVDPQGQVRVADFGLATALDVQRLTQSGTFMGTPGFMSPEQIDGDQGLIGPPADVWSLGVVLYLALTGEEPFRADSLMAMLHKVLNTTPKRPRELNAEVPAALEAITQRCLERDPSRRYPSAHALAEDLARWLRGEQVSARGSRLPRGKRPWVLLGLGLGLAALLAVGMGAGQPDPYGPGGQWPTQQDPDALVSAPREAPSDHVSPRAQALEAAPAWVVELAEADRPPLPLPAGLGFGERPGDYVNLADASLLVWIPGTRFAMGSADEEADADERPVREVTLGGYFLGKHEVSWGQYLEFCYQTSRAIPRQVIEGHPGRFVAEDGHPVFHVTWEDAQAYCAWAGLRLPTEAEWELGARGPDGRRFPWGDHLAPAATPVANVADLSVSRLAPTWEAVDDAYDDGEAYLSLAGAYPAGASPYGCLDMAGNVWEWVADAYAPYPAGAASDPRGPASGPERVVRGGSWCYPVRDCRGANRHSLRPEQRFDAVGFRVAR